MNTNETLLSLSELRENYIGSAITYRKAIKLVHNDMCALTSQQDNKYRYVIEDKFDDFTVDINIFDEKIEHKCTCGSIQSCCTHAAAALIEVSEYINNKEIDVEEGGEAYTPEEMKERVLQERQEKADKEEFRIDFNDNVHGEHTVITSSGVKYSVTIRDFETDSGYCSCPDYKFNKLGTCKHLIFATKKVRKNFSIKEITKRQPYPFVEVYCDPFNDYNITYYHEGDMPESVGQLLQNYFNSSKYILPEQYHEFINFSTEAQNFKKILIRPEALEKIEKYFEQEELKKLQQHITPDFSRINANLFEYQKEGVLFSLFKSGSIIADEMGLGKTIQAIAIAVLKKDIYDLKKTLIICPASLKYQWKQEIERFSDESVAIVEGHYKDRHALYKKSDYYFLIANYEAVLRDITVIRQHPPDMVILDEAQRIKNYETKTSYAVKAIPKKHSLVITGTPIENRLIDLYSIVNFIDPGHLAPLWEFSMNHCYFDKSKKNKITGYYNLQKLKDRLASKVIRREKKDVMSQLPELQEMTVPIALSAEQSEMHSGFARSLAPLLAKKHKTFYDMQRIFQILTKMRMVCDSTYLIDKETNISPKLKELEEILLDKLDIVQQKKKVIIFSEWTTMLHLIENMLRSHNISYVMLSGKVAVKNRGKLIDEFSNNPDCHVFLSTEAGGTGLNLQAADTVINFELPWNPAKKNQRIGRIHRIGQESQKLTVINLVARASIEERIASGIVLKEALFDAVLNEKDMTDEVDFSAKGRSTMIDQINKMLTPLLLDEEEAEIEETVVDEEAIQQMTLFDEDVNAIEEGQAKEAANTTDKQKAATGKETTDKNDSSPSAADMENTLNQGMQFLSGLFKMTSGKDLITGDQSIEVNKETGEVVMKFKLPGFN